MAPKMLGAWADPIRIVPMFGEVSEHAVLLVQIADATGREVREDFNGDDLIAYPGQRAEAVWRDWMARRMNRQNEERE